MKISIDSKYIATVDTSLLGYIGETNARTIKVEQPEVPGADTYKLRLDYGGVLVFEVQIEDGVIPVTGSLLRKSGHVKCQWLATAADGDNYRLVAKSNVFVLRVEGSISDEIAPVPTYEQSVKALEKVLISGSTAAENAQAAIQAKDTVQSIKTQVEELHTAAEKAAEKAINAGEYVSVISCGCVGDGVTDDTAGFKAAIDTAIKKGKTLYINPGTYLITDRLIINKPLTVIGGNHDECIIKYRGEYHTETAYDPEYYPESNACFIVTADNCRLENFIISGGEDKEHTSQSNGIILHYVKPNGTQYDAAQRVQLNQIDVKCFKNGLYLYAGWNRQITCCHFIDNAECGIKYYPLELESVGEWSGSGDVIIACQFVGNLAAGYYAYANFESTIWNSVFEYNTKAIHLDNCRDVVFKSCWNEANYENIYVRGSCKFEGGYNINNGTVTHELVGGSDLIQFETENSNTMTRQGNVIFNQSSGVITKGVEIGTEIENLISNPYFEEASGGTDTIPSTINWNIYPSWCGTADTDNKYNKKNSLKIVVADQTSDVFYGAWAAAITVDPATEYVATITIKTPSRAEIDGNGVMCYIAWKNSSGETIVLDNRQITMIGDNNWEEKDFLLKAPNGAASLIIGFGLARNGTIYVAEPLVSYNDGLTRSNVYIRQSTDPKYLDVIDISGDKVDTLPMTAQHNDDINVVQNNINNLGSTLSNRINVLEQKINTMFSTNVLSALNQIVLTGKTKLFWDGSRWNYNDNSSAVEGKVGDDNYIYIPLTTSSEFVPVIGSTYNNPRIIASLSTEKFSNNITPETLNIILNTNFDGNSFNATLTRKGADIPHGTFYINWILLADKK